MVRKINSNPQEVEKKRLRFALIYIGRTLGILNDSAENFLQYGTTIDEEMILEKIKARNKARADKDFTKADTIRDDLLALGIMLDDGIHGTTWKKI